MNIPVLGLVFLTNMSLFCWPGFCAQPSLSFDRQQLELLGQDFKIEVHGYVDKKGRPEIDDCSSDGDRPLVRRKINLYARYRRLRRAFYVDKTSSRIYASDQPKRSDPQFAIDLLYWGDKKTRLDELKHFAAAQKTLSISEPKRLPDFAQFDKLQFSIGPAKNTYAFSDRDGDPAGKVVACITGCTREQVRSLRCRVAQAAPQPAPPLIGDSGPTTGTLAPPAPSTGEGDKCTTIAKSPAILQCEQRQADLKTERDRALDQLNAANEKYEAVNAELKKYKDAAQAKEAGAKPQKGTVDLRLYDEEQSGRKLSARLYEGCQSYDGNPEGFKPLGFSPKQSGFNFWNASGLPLPNAAGRGCLVLREGTIESCHAFPVPDNGVLSLPLSAVLNQPCPRPVEVSLRIVLENGESLGDADVEDIEKSLRPMLGQAVVNRSVSLRQPAFEKFKKELDERAKSNDPKRQSLGNDNYRLIFYLESAGALTLRVRPTFKTLGNLAIKLTHSGGGVEKYCKAWLTVPESRRKAPADWAKLAERGKLLDKDGRIKLFQEKAHYIADGDAAKLAIRLTGAEPLSLGFEHGTKAAQNCSLDEEASLIKEAEIAGKEDIVRVVRPVGPPLIAIATSDSKWQTDKLVLDSQYQEFWNATLKLVDGIAARQPWELVAVTKLQSDVRDAGDHWRLRDNAAAALFHDANDRSAYAQELFQAFVPKQNSRAMQPLGYASIDAALENIYGKIEPQFGPEGPSKAPASIMIAGPITSSKVSEFCREGNQGGLASREWFRKGHRLMVIELWGEAARKLMTDAKMAEPVKDSGHLYRCKIASGGEGAVAVYGLEFPDALQPANQTVIFEKLQAEAEKLLTK
jgi:hypothetical protein